MEAPIDRGVREGHPRDRCPRQIRPARTTSSGMAWTAAFRCALRGHSVRWLNSPPRGREPCDSAPRSSTPRWVAWPEVNWPPPCLVRAGWEWWGWAVPDRWRSWNGRPPIHAMPDFLSGSACSTGQWRAADAGVEVLVARGAEGGGHGEPLVGTLPLLEGVLNVVSVLVLAAGGISSPRGLVAVLAAGASGAWLGTVFATCPESLATDAVRSALVAASGTDTVTTRVFDVALGYPLPVRYPERALPNGFWERWEGHVDRLSADFDALSEFIAARERGDFGYLHIDAGQGVGDLTAVRAASEVIEQLCTGAADLLGRWTS